MAKNKKPLSRQRQYQKRNAAEGVCMTCGKERDPESATYCEFHKIEQRRRVRERHRKVSGWKPWVPGGRGRPPKGAES